MFDPRGGVLKCLVRTARINANLEFDLWDWISRDASRVPVIQRLAVAWRDLFLLLTAVQSAILQIFSKSGQDSVRRKNRCQDTAILFGSGRFC